MKTRFTDILLISANLQDLLCRFTLDSASELFFGLCVNSLQDTLPYPYHAPAHLQTVSKSSADEFSTAFQDAQVAVSYRARLSWLWPWFEIFKDKTADPMRVINAYLEPIIQRALQPEDDEVKYGDKIEGGHSLLDHLAHLTHGKPVLDLRF